MLRADRHEASRRVVDTVREIADYIRTREVDNPAAYATARCWLLEAFARMFAALSDPACARQLGPIAPGATTPGGARVPGTSFELDPERAALNIGVMLCWKKREATTDPADNLAAILAIADFCARRRCRNGESPLSMGRVMEAMVAAHEIQGAVMRLADELELPVRVASAAAATHLLGASGAQTIAALTLAWLDCETQRTVGGTASRGVRFALGSFNDEIDQLPDVELASAHRCADLHWDDLGAEAPPNTMPDAKTVRQLEPSFCIQHGAAAGAGAV